MTNKKIVYKPIDPEIEKLVHQHGGNRESVIEVLSDLNAANNLNPDTMLQAARALRIPAHQVYGMATFYSMLAPLSQKNVLRVCDGPACWLKRVTLDPGGVLVEKWAEGMPRECGVVRTSCLGLCDRAPAVLLNNEQAGPVEPENLEKACQGWRGIPTDYGNPRKGELRVMLAKAAEINPDKISSALQHGAYEGLKKALDPADGRVHTTFNQAQTATGRLSSSSSDRFRSC